MRRTPQTILAILMLAAFLASLAVSGFDSKRLTHDLDHGGRPAIAAVAPDHDHAPPSDAGSGSEPLDNAEHHLLHAVNYCPALASSTFTFFSEAPIRTMASSFIVTVLPPAAPEPPFRPPRASALA